MNEARALSEPPSALKLELPLNDISDLFNAPRVAPFSPGPLEGAGVSGVDDLSGLLHLDRSLQRAKVLPLLLPAEKAVACTAESVTGALRRHVRRPIDREQLDLRNSYRYGWRVALFSIVTLAICLGLSSLFASDVTGRMRPLIRTTLEAGFEIIGWVILWHPIQVLVFAPVSIRIRLAGLRTLAALDVVMRAAPRQSGARAAGA